MKIAPPPRSLKILYVANACLRSAPGLFVPVYAVFVARVGGDLRHAGELVAVYGAMGLLVGLWVTLRSEKTQQRLFVASYFVLAVAALMMTQVEHHMELHLVQVLFGLGDGLNGAVLYSYMARFSGKFPASTSFELDVLLSKGPVAAAGFAGGYLSHHFGFGAVFSTMACLYLIALALVLHVRHVVDKRDGETSSSTATQ